MNPETVKENIKEAKKPSTKVYIAVFLVIAASLAVYFLFSNMIQFSDEKAGLIENPVFIDHPTEALTTSNEINTDVQAITSDLDSIGNILGDV